MIVIAGGGLSGLSTAYFLHQAGVEYVLLEKENQVGGVIKSIVNKGYLLEEGPNSLLIDDMIKNLIHELGLDNQVVYPEKVNKQRYILKGGKYEKLPSQPLELFFSNFFSGKSKFKILSEFFRKKGSSSTETVEEFFIEHFGKEVSDYALNPFISGIYAGDPKQLVLDEAFPILRKFEVENGSVLRGIVKNAGKRKTMINFLGGMASLPAALAKKLNIRYNSRMLNVRRKEGGLLVLYEGNSGSETIKADQIVLCLPAHDMGLILKEYAPEFSDTLLQVNYPPMSIVHTSYSLSSVKSPLFGFGGLHPKIENKFSAGSIWSSTIFPHTALADTMLYTSFVGGEQYREHALLSSDIIKQRTSEELQELFAIQSSPLFQHFTHWSKAIPQYDKKQAKAKEFLIKYESENVFVCSNVFGGISMPDCIKKGNALAQKLLTLSSN